MRFRRAAGELAEFPDEVRLVGVSTCGSGDCASTARSPALENLQCVLKTRNACEPFRRESHHVLKTPFEMAPRDPCQRSGVAHRRDPSLSANCVDCGPHVAIDARVVENPFEAGRHRACGVRKRWLPGAGVEQAIRQRSRQFTQVERVPRKTMLRDVDERGRAIGAKTNANDGNRPARPEHERRRELAGEDQARLPLDPPIVVQHVERSAEMQHDLGPTIGQDRLRRGGQIVALPFQGPDAANDTREQRGWQVFPVLHGRATLTRVSHSFKRDSARAARVCAGGVE
jgi:hypothetical protein